jgi:hypothetical protein
VGYAVLMRRVPEEAEKADGVGVLPAGPSRETRRSGTL